MVYWGEKLTRLDVVKRVIAAFVLGNDAELGGRSNDLIGISGFARYSDEYAPLTLDHKNVIDFIQNITFAHEIEDGTMIGDALYNTVLRLIAADTFLNKKDSSLPPIASKIIVLLTDGRQTEGGYDPLAAAEFARENGVTVYVIAITNPQQSSFDRFLHPVRSIDVNMLKRIAEITDGKFAAVSSGQSLLGFYETIDRLEKSDISKEILTWKEFYLPFLLLALGLIAAEQFLLRGILRKV